MWRTKQLLTRKDEPTDLDSNRTTSSSIETSSLWTYGEGFIATTDTRLIFCQCQSQDMDVLFWYFLSLPPCVGSRQFAHLLPSFEVITVSPIIFVSNTNVQLLTYVTKTNIFMEMWTYLFLIPESRSCDRATDPTSHGDFWRERFLMTRLLLFYHFDQNIIIFKNEKRYPLAREKDVWKKNWTVLSVKIISFMGEFVCWAWCCAANFCVWQNWDIYHQLRKNGRALNLQSIAEFLQMTRCLWPLVRWM